MQWEIWAIGVFFTFAFGVMAMLFRKADAAAGKASQKADTAQQCANVLEQKLSDHIDAASQRFDMFEKHADERHVDIKTSINELKKSISTLRNGRARTKKTGA